MVAISFKPEWREKLLSGEKTQTIRPYSKKRFNQLRNADKLQLYINQRSSDNESLGEASPIDVFKFCFPPPNTNKYIASYPELQRLAERDGFRFVEEMYSWFFDQYCKQDNELYSMEFMVIRFKKIE